MMHLAPDADLRQASAPIGRFWADCGTGQATGDTLPVVWTERVGCTEANTQTDPSGLVLPVADGLFARFGPGA